MFVSHQDGNTRIGASAGNILVPDQLLPAQASSQQEENE
jgi:hypothetical protein